PPAVPWAVTSQEEGAVLADDQLLSLRQAAVRRTNGRVSADETVHDLVPRLDDRLPDHDGRFDVRPDESGSIPDALVRTHVPLRPDHAVLTDHGGTADDAPRLNDAPGADPHAPIHPP